MLILSSVSAHAMLRQLCYMPQKSTVLASRFTQAGLSQRRILPASRSPFLSATAVKVAPKTYSALAFQNSDYKKQNDDRRFKFKWNHATALKALAGTGAALSALCAGSALAEQKADKEQAVQPYKPPFDEQRKQYYARLLALPWGNVAKKYIDQLEAEEKALMKEFFEVTEITQEEYEKEAAEFTLQYDKLPSPIQEEYPLSDTLKQMIIIELGICSINPKEIKIAQKKRAVDEWSKHKKEDGHLSFGADLDFGADRRGIWANEGAGWHASNLSDHGESIVKHFILHEIMHILFDDGFEGILQKRFVRSFFDKASSSKKWSLLFGGNPKDVYLRYARFIERRADILAGLVDLNAARAYMNVNQRSVKPQFRRTLAYVFSLGNVDLDSYDEYHEPISVRAAYMTQLHDEMLEAMNKRNTRSSLKK